MTDRSRARVARLVLLLVVAAEFAIPLFLVPRLSSCCLRQDLPFGVVWADLAVGLAAVAFVGWVAIDWVVRGFTGAHAPTRETIELPTSKRPSSTSALWPDVGARRGQRLCTAYGFVSLGWIAVGSLFDEVLLLNTVNVIRAKYTTLPPLTLEQFVIGGVGGQFELYIAAAAVALALVGTRCRRLAFSAGLLWTLVDMAMGFVIAPISVALLFSCLLRLWLAVNAVRGAYAKGSAAGLAPSAAHFG